MANNYRPVWMRESQQVIAMVILVTSLVGCHSKELSINQSSPRGLIETVEHAEEGSDITVLLACMHRRDRDAWAPYFRFLARESREVDLLAETIRDAYGQSEVELLSTKEALASLHGYWSQHTPGWPTHRQEWVFENVAPGRVRFRVQGRDLPSLLHLTEIDGKWYIGPMPEMMRERSVDPKVLAARGRDTDIKVEEMRQIRRDIRSGRMSREQYHQWLKTPSGSWYSVDDN
jgi:hypothetical protein